MKKLIALLCVIAILAGCGSSSQVANLSSSEPASTPSSINQAFTSIPAAPQSQPLVFDLKIHFIDVGQADAILIQSNEDNMLIDAGNNADGALVCDYLTQSGIDALDYVIGTHPHEDHIGGLDTVIRAFDIDTVILPEKEHTTQTFEDVLDAIIDKGLSITKPVVGKAFALGSASFTIIAPNRDYGDELNNWSVGLKLVNGDTSFVLCGDAESDSESDMLNNGIDLKADVLKIGHHGSSTSTTRQFLDRVSPTYAVICCGKDNSYGHPDAETLDKLNGIKLFRTDEQGTIIATSDGKTITWSTSPIARVTSSAPVPAAPTSSTAVIKPSEPAPTAESVSVQVHIAKTGKKYHTAGCRYLSKSDVVVSLSTAKQRGLTPCSVCNPPS